MELGERARHVPRHAREPASLPHHLTHSHLSYTSTSRVTCIGLRIAWIASAHTFIPASGSVPPDEAAIPTMPRYKRDALAAELDAPTPDEPQIAPEDVATLARLRSMWEFASLMQYIFLFGHVVKIDENFDIEVGKPLHVPTRGFHTSCRAAMHATKTASNGFMIAGP